MKTLIMALMLFCFTGEVTGEVAGEVRTDNQLSAFMVGYSTATIYDIYWYGSGNQRVSIIATNQIYSIQDKSNTYKYVWGKMTMGVLSGIAFSFYNASNYNKNVDWNDVVFSGLGGLTSVIVHF